MSQLRNELESNERDMPGSSNPVRYPFTKRISWFSPEKGGLEPVGAQNSHKVVPFPPFENNISISSEKHVQN